LTSRTYEPIEELMMSLYISTFLSQLRHVVHLRLGQPRGFDKQHPAPPETRNLLLSTLPEADLVVKTESQAYIYEFTVWRPHTKLGQLRYYRTLLPSTPGYTDLSEEEVNLIIVTAQNDPQVDAMAKRDGVEVVYFSTPELDRKLAERRGG
jgi:hypothetical protein